jgi:hypothetical protein
MTGGTWVKCKGWGTEILSHVEYGHSETNLTHSHSRWFGRDSASVWLYCCSDDNSDCYQWISLSRYRMSSLLDSCLGHNVRCLNKICYTSFSKVVDLIASEFELYKKFLSVILEVCIILLVETHRKMKVPFHETFNPLESCNSCFLLFMWAAVEFLGITIANWWIQYNSVCASFLSIWVCLNIFHFWCIACIWLCISWAYLLPL